MVSNLLTSGHSQNRQAPVHAISVIPARFLCCVNSTSPLKPASKGLGNKLKNIPFNNNMKKYGFVNREDDTDVESWFTHLSLQQNCVRWHRGGLLAALQVSFFGGSSYSSVVFMQEVTNLSD